MYDTLLETAQNKEFGTLSKHENFFDEYDLNLRKLRTKKCVKILEIGVQGGGSLAMWRNYFDEPLVVGLDVDPACKRWENENVKIYIGDQSDKALLVSLERENGPFDLIVDDGGHTMTQQRVTFETLWPLLSDGGVYVIEDLHTSYWPSFGGGIGEPGTMVEYLKRMIDEIHFSAVEDSRSGLYKRVRNKLCRLLRPPCFRGPKNEIQRSVQSINFGDSIVFIHKNTDKKMRLLKF